MPVLPPLLRVPRRVFVDSVAYLALLNRSERHYTDAVSLLGTLSDHHYRQFTTNAVLFEAHALVLSRLGIARATQFLHDLRESRTVIVRVSVRDEARAEAIIMQYRDKDFSLTDALSFAVMERLHIAEAFSFDKHFSQYGFHALWKEEA